MKTRIGGGRWKYRRKESQKAEFGATQNERSPIVPALFSADTGGLWSPSRSSSSEYLMEKPERGRTLLMLLWARESNYLMFSSSRSNLTTSRVWNERFCSTLAPGAFEKDC